MTTAAERLAVIAAVTVPVTAVSSIVGLNVLVFDAPQPPALTIAVVIMIVVSVILPIRCKRRGRWSPGCPIGRRCRPRRSVTGAPDSRDTGLEPAGRAEGGRA